MSRKRRTLHEDDAWPLNDRWGMAQAAYSAEDDIFSKLYPEEKKIVTQEGGERMIDAIYRRYAPNRQRPRLDLRWYGPWAYRKGDTKGHYDVVRHTIWGPGGVMDIPTLIHEIAHSLTWRQSWRAHGPEFMRFVIELHCWHLRIPLKEGLEDVREDHFLEVPTKLRLGHDPTNVNWIRKKRRA